MKIQNTIRFLSLGLLLSVVGLVLFNCSKDDDSPAPSKTIQVKLATSASLGKYLTDSAGNTLYFFAEDANGKPNCKGFCANYWPYYYKPITSQDQLGEGLSLSDFDTASVDGNKITRYKGWPLYYWAPDGKTKEASGLTTGEGVGKTWMVAKTDYTVLLSETSVHDYTTNTDSTRLFWVDNAGKTLYYWTIDSTNKSNCTSAFDCIVHWPVFYVENIVMPSYFNKADFGTILRSDGAKQTTYKTKPLYYYKADNSTRGVVNGQGTGQNTWFVVAP